MAMGLLYPDRDNIALTITPTRVYSISLKTPRNPPKNMTETVRKRSAMRRRLVTGFVDVGTKSTKPVIEASPTTRQIGLPGKCNEAQRCRLLGRFRLLCASN